MNYINLLRLFVLKRPGFQSQKYGVPTLKHFGYLYQSSIETRHSTINYSIFQTQLT